MSPGNVKRRLGTDCYAPCSCCTTLPRLSASSTRPNPLKRIAYATDTWIEVVQKRVPTAEDASQFQWAPSEEPVSSASRRRSPTTQPPQVRSSDSIRLSVRGFDQTFFLHLEPNDNIVPPEGAKMKVWRFDEATGEDVIVREETVRRQDVRAYHGVVVHESITTQRLREDELGVSRIRMGVDDVGVMGPAAIILHDDGAVSGVPRFEGTFEWNGNIHTIQSAQGYNKVRQAFDPRPHKRSLDEDHLIMHRSSDFFTERDMLDLGLHSRAEDSSTGGCSFSGHDYNINNPLILSESNNFNTSRSPMDFFAKRPAESPSLHSMMRRGLAWWDASSEDLFDRRDFDFPSDLTPRSAPFSYEVEHEKLLTKRQSDGRGSSGNTSYVSTIGDTSGCPSSAMVVYVGVAADCTFTSDYNGNASATSSAILNIMNSVSIIYRNTFNVSLGVVELDVRDSTCSTGNGDANWNQDCNALTLDDRLSAFSEWRGRQDPNGIGVWLLMTSCNSGAEVGVAWLGTLCMVESYSSGGDTVSGAAVSASSVRISQVVAHEIGHVFGAVHDCTTGCSISGNLAVQGGSSTCCPQSSGSCSDAGAHIMSPVASESTTIFSPCSIGNVCTLLSGGLNTSCIETQGQRETVSAQQCGNGILETAAGEECDAGPDGSACCTSDCRLVNGAVCDPASSVCCEDTCQFASSSTVCRPSKDSSDCDTVEYCSGTSDQCPTDTFRDNGDSCGNGLSCANGRCTSRDLQCQQQTGGAVSYTRSCDAGGDNSCSLSCQDPSSSLVCTIFQTNFVDGTKCGSGGFCEAGTCQYGSGSNAFTRWYRNNLRIAIPVTIVIGIIVLVILAALLRCCCCPTAGSRRKSRRNGAVAANRRNHGAARRGPFAPPPMRQMPPGQGAPPPIPPRAYIQAPYESYQAPPGAPPYHGGGGGGGGGGWVDPTAWNGPNVRR